MPSQIKLNGSGFVNTTAYLQREYGKQAVEEVLARLPELARQSAKWALVRNMYPADHVGDFLNAVRTVLGPEDPEINYKVGLEAARSSVSVLQRMVLRLSNPHGVIVREALAWKRISTEGLMEVADQGDGHVVLRLSDFGYVNPEFCAQRLRGWYQAFLELAGCRIVESSHAVCRSLGSDCCEWRYQWSTK